MERKSLTIDYEEYNSPEELAQLDKALVNEAIAAVEGSYAPYSHFNVGAAVRLVDGTIVRGANQENAAYPSGLCAERTAMFAASANNPGINFEALAIVCFQNGKQLTEPGYPCGSCRQVMAQYERVAGKPLRIIVAGSKTIQIFTGVDSILPFIFTSL